MPAASMTNDSVLDRLGAWLDELHVWLTEPGSGQYGPGLFDFDPDWKLRRLRRRDDPRQHSD